MAAPTQYTFELKEAAIALIKEAGLHEGVWIVGFEFALGAGLFGAMPMGEKTAGSDSPPAEAKPGGFIQINRVQLSRYVRGMPEVSFAVDAAVVNPDPKAKPPTSAA
jgi:hypothetical protein